MDRTELCAELLSWASKEENVVIPGDRYNDVCVFCDYKYTWREREGLESGYSHDDDCLHLKAKALIGETE